MAVPVKGNNNYSFGIPTGDVSASGMIVEQATLNSSVQVDEEGVDNLGLVAAYAIGGEQFEVNISGFYTGSGPNVGQSITVDGNTLFVTRVETSWGNRDWKKASVTAKGYEGIS